MVIYLLGIDRACLVGIAADSNESCNLAVEKCVHVLRYVGRNIDTDPLQYLGRLRVDKAGRLLPGTMHVNKRQQHGGCL